MTNGLIAKASLIPIRLIPLATIVVFLFLPSHTNAQDLFEIQVYPYDTVEPRHTMVEFHMNHFPSGTKTTENGEFPNNHRLVYSGATV